MAVARITCGACGADISSYGKICPQCGASIELPVAMASEHKGIPPSGCPACGHQNVNPGAYCESCGAKLRSDHTSGTKRPAAHGAAQTRKRSGGQAVVKGSLKRLVGEHTPIVGIGVLILGVLLYGELSRDGFSSKPHSPPPSSTGLDVKLNEIEHLQKVVDASPTDSVNLLKLANMLQDQSVQDKGLLSRAVSTYKKYLEMNPASQNPRVDLGICYFELSKNDPENANEYLHLALREMETVYKANPRHQFAAFNLGIVHLNEGSAPEANEWFRRAVAINLSSDLGQRAKKLLEEHTFGESPKQSSQEN